HAASETRVGPSPYLLYVDHPYGVDTVFNNGQELDAGTTDFRRVDVPVTPGLVTLEFSISDAVDGIVDSAVILDNLSTSALEIIDPNPPDPRDTLINGEGKVIYPDPDPPEELVTNGRPIHSVAADGVTQVLLRSDVPDPNPVTFSVTSGLA